MANRLGQAPRLRKNTQAQPGVACTQLLDEKFISQPPG